MSTSMIFRSVAFTIALIAIVHATPEADNVVPETTAVDVSATTQASVSAALLDITKQITDPLAELKTLVEQHPELNDYGDVLSNFNAENVDDADLPKVLCKSEELQEMCKQYTDGEVGYDELVKTGLNMRDSAMTEEDKQQQSKTCANWKSKSMSSDTTAALKATEIVDEASPYMTCLCTAGNGPSYCGLQHSKSLVSMVQTFEKVVITEGGEEVTQGGSRTSREGVMQHPALAELIQHLMTESGETTPSGRRKNVMDHIVEKAGGTGELLMSTQSNQVCRDIAKMTSFDPVKVAKKLKITLKGATGGTFSCSGGCDVSGSVSIQCTAYEVAQVELGYDISNKHFFIKFKMCVPVLSDILDILSDIPIIKDFLAGKGIDGGCLLLGQGILRPDYGVARLQVNLPRSVYPFTLRFTAHADVVWDRSIGDTRDIQCKSWLYSNRPGVLGTIYEAVDHFKCWKQLDGVGIYRHNWAAGVNADISIELNPGFWSQTLGGFGGDMIF